MPREASGDEARTFFDRVIAVLRARATPSERPVIARRWPFVAAFVLFVVTTVVALTQLPESETSVRWWLLVLLVLAGTPLNLAATGYEFVAMARLLDIRIGARDATRVAVLSSAANLLPIPGSVLVRGVTLRERGATFGAIGGAIATVGVAFLSVTGLVCGAVLAASERRVLGLVLVAGGVVGVALTWLLVRRATVVRTKRALVRVLMAEVALIAVVGVRLWVVLPALGFATSARQAAALAGASVAATATGFFPAGLGIRELFSGAAAGLVDLSLAVGVVAGAVDRITFGIGLLPVGLWLLWRGRGEPPAPSSAADVGE